MNAAKRLIALSAVSAALFAAPVFAGTLFADLSITKTDGAANSTPGATVAYTIVATNNGPSDAPMATVTDSFPAALSACSWTCTASAGSSCTAAGAGNINDAVSLLNGGTATYTATCDIDAGATGMLTNTATVAVAGGVDDPNLANNSATDTNGLIASSDLSVTKTDGFASSTPGTPISYTIVASNAGPSDQTGATVTDTFPAALTGCAWTCSASAGSSCTGAGAGNIADSVNLLVGGSATYTANCVIDPGAAGTLDNTATVAVGAGSDPVPGNNSATDSNTLGAVADLSITKTDNLLLHTAGTPIEYTIVVQNAGPSGVSDATVTDIFQLPLMNCSWTSVAAGGASGNTNGSGDINEVLTMPPGSSVTYTATCDVAQAAGTLVNTATVSSASATDPNPGNESATDDNTRLIDTRPVPTLSSWSILALLLMIGFIGLLSSRRIGA